MKAIGYVRVSTNRQDHSIEAQERQIRAQADLKGFELTDLVIDRDEYSGNLKRPGVQRVLQAVREKATDAVIVCKLDRMTRSTRDAIDLIDLFTKYQVAFISIAESLDTVSPMGRFFVRTLASIAELEREMICERTKTVMRHLKSKNLSTGRIPYGWRKVEKGQPIVPDEKEQSVISKVRLMRGRGLSLQECADMMNEEGLRLRNGCLWRWQYVDRICKTGRMA